MPQSEASTSLDVANVSPKIFERPQRGGNASDIFRSFVALMQLASLGIF
jgi:hypothetical protein